MSLVYFVVYEWFGYWDLGSVLLSEHTEKLIVQDISFNFTVTLKFTIAQQVRHSHRVII